MAKILSNLPKLKGTRKKARRIGRGYGSTKGGHTVGYGTKGQKSRSGGKIPIWFEGGQTPLVRRLPYKGGFVNPNKKNVKVLNLNQLESILKEAKVVTPSLLVKNGIVDKTTYNEIKILGRGSISKSIKFKGFAYSKTARAKIESAGGKAL